MFASTFFSAATALFFFAPSVVLGAPAVTRDLALAGAKVTEVQSIIAETKTKITVIATNLQATELTTTTVNQYVVGLTSINTAIVDCKSKIEEIKYRTVGVHVGVEVPLAPIASEVQLLLEVVAVLLAPVTEEVSLLPAEVLATLGPVVKLLGVTINGLLLTIEGVLGGVSVLVIGTLHGVVLTLCQTLHITALIHI